MPLLGNFSSSVCFGQSHHSYRWTLSLHCCGFLSLKDLHKTILGSVSQQQQQLRCMEEHVSSFLASKYDEEAAREEKQAMEKIAAILASLTAKKTAMHKYGQLLWATVGKGSVIK